jgi:hypothetical protein
MHNDLASDAHFKIYKCKSLASDAHFKIYKCKSLASDAHEPWLPMHKLQNHGDLLLYVFSYSFFNLFFNQQEKSIPPLPTTGFSVKYTVLKILEFIVVFVGDRIR